jgi:hypothetical protein
MTFVSDAMPQIIIGNDYSTFIDFKLCLISSRQIFILVAPAIDSGVPLLQHF